MAEKHWEVVKVCYCERAGHQVAFEAEIVYPADFLPDPPRLVARRCSSAEECNLVDKPSCIWCGTNPNYQPV
jgi:hypothetical protein